MLNFNGRKDTLACLDSLTASTWPRLTTIVVDNASETGIGPEVRERYPKAITFGTTSNLGFAGGMNVGVECAQAIGADYVLLRGVKEIVASSGEAMLVSTPAIEEVGRLDETRYLRLEDIDWSLRMGAVGRKNYVALGAVRQHRARETEYPPRA